VLYAAAAKGYYFGATHIHDPFQPQSQIPALYSWLQFAPLSKLGQIISLPPTLIPLLWRALGGALLGPSLYILFRIILAPSVAGYLWPLWCTMFCITDIGFIKGRLLVDNLIALHAIKAARFVQPYPDHVATYRVVSPLLNLPFLLGLAAVIACGRLPKFQYVLFAGLLLGASINLYFFNWTAAVLAILLLITLHIRSREIVAALAVILLVAGIVGSPQILYNLHEFSNASLNPILQRVCRGYHLAEGDPERTIYIKDFWALAKIAVGFIAVFLMRRTELTFIWLLCVSAFILENSGIITGLEFENFHWKYVVSPFGEIIVLSVLAIIIYRHLKLGNKLIYSGLWSIPIFLLITSAAYKYREALYLPENKTVAQLAHDIAPLNSTLESRQNCIIAGPKLAVAIAILSSPCGQLYHMWTPTIEIIPDREVNERNALNAWLEGQTEDQYAREAPEQIALCDTHNSDWQPAHVAAERLSIFAGLSDPSVAGLLLRKYHPNYLLLSSGSTMPTRGGKWSAISRSNDWVLYRLDELPDLTAEVL
jgi:hypothetical protein